MFLVDCYCNDRYDHYSFIIAALTQKVLVFEFLISLSQSIRIKAQLTKHNGIISPIVIIQADYILIVIILKIVEWIWILRMRELWNERFLLSWISFVMIIIHSSLRPSFEKLMQLLPSLIVIHWDWKSMTCLGDPLLVYSLYMFQNDKIAFFNVAVHAWSVSYGDLLFEFL